jgi:hypothetical protein
MPRYGVRRRIEQETTVMAGSEREAAAIAQSLHNLEWDDTGYVELEAAFDLRKMPPVRNSARPKGQLN